MALNRTIYAKSFSFNSVTYDRSTGGPISAIIDDGGEEVEDRVAADEYPTDLSVVNKFLECRIVAREVKWATPVKGTNSNIVLTTTDKDGNDTTLTLASMTLIQKITTQDRAQPAITELRFRHLSSDGTTEPLS